MTVREIITQYQKPLSPLPAGVREEGFLRRKVRAVLFDVYGTLFVSESGDIAVTQAGVSGETAEKLSLLHDLFRRHKRGSDVHGIIQRFFEEIRAVHERLEARGVERPEVEIDRVWMNVLGIADIETARRVAVEYESIVNPVYPMPNSLATIEALNSRGILLGVISNAQFFTPILFEVFFGRTLGDLGFFSDLVIFSFLHGAAKPSALLFSRAAESLRRKSIETSHALYVGNDMGNDVVPALEAGSQTALVAGDRRSLRMRKDDARCAGVKPDLKITDLLSIVREVDAAEKRI
jgi:putative hydrolase of the HAD superfamily